MEFTIHLHFVIHPVLWDSTYLTSQSDDVDTSHTERLFNTGMDDSHVSSELNTWNTWFAGKQLQCGSIFFGYLQTW